MILGDGGRDVKDVKGVIGQIYIVVWQVEIWYIVHCEQSAIRSKILLTIPPLTTHTPTPGLSTPP